mmetsp:Transcript_3618/g.5615  ORF Transcript_3618/g.5615 Transcript_3618/m.5615 type:complete len:212 (-) Transcript_3618:991-1626(-)
MSVESTHKHNTERLACDRSVFSIQHNGRLHSTNSLAHCHVASKRTHRVAAFQRSADSSIHCSSTTSSLTPHYLLPLPVLTRDGKTKNRVAKISLPPACPRLRAGPPACPPCCGLRRRRRIRRSRSRPYPCVRHCGRRHVDADHPHVTTLVEVIKRVFGHVLQRQRHAPPRHRAVALTQKVYLALAVAPVRKQHRRIRRRGGRGRRRGRRRR